MGTAGARNILLLEIPLSLRDKDGDDSTFRQALLDAEGQFRNGDYNSCIASCRTVIEEVARRRPGTGTWAGDVLKQLSDVRKQMTKPERETAIWATLEHYAHLAHHGPGKGGSPGYSRPEAQFLLSMVGATVTYAESEPSPAPD